MKSKKLITKMALAMAITVSGSAMFPIIASAKSVDNHDTKIEESTNKSIKLTQQEKEDLSNWFDTYGVNKETQKNLMNKLENGQKWDCLNSENPHKDVVNQSYTKKVFNDGSICITGVDLSNAKIVENKDVVIPTAVDPGQITSGSGYTSYKGAQVYQYFGIINASFNADFYLSKGGSGIDKVENKKVIVVGGGVSNVVLAIDRAQEAYDPARATLSFETASYNGGTGANCWLSLYVGNGTYYSKYSF